MTGTSEKCIACYPKIELGLQPQCFVNCIGKIRFAGWISKPENANPENPIDYLVHIKKVALPIFPQFGLEPNVYYVPPLHVPAPFLFQMFGPAVKEAIRTYRNAPNDLDLAALLTLFGSTERIVPKWKRRGDVVYGYDENNAEIISVPIREPVHTLPRVDSARGVARTNIS
jgi:nitrate reductase beta subunit